MSSENVELHRRGLEVFNARDLGAFIACCDPSVEVHSAMAAIDGAVFRGHEGLRRWHRELEEAWGDQVRLEPEAYFDLGEHTLAFVVMHGRGRHSGVDVAMAAAQVAKWRDSLAVYYKGYAHREDALSDLGVSEDALEPIAP